MKPTLQLSEIRGRRDSVTALPARSAMPKTDCCFQSRSFDDFSRWGGGKRVSSLRGISNEYFEKEARHHFASEAAFFALIVVTIAAPLYQVARALSVWVL